jgi:hypothetical protein
MNRFVLTLLALMTGLVAQVSPAQAAVRGAGEAQVGSVQLARSAVLLAREVTIRAVRDSGFESDAGLIEAAPLPRFPLAVAGVRIGIDRARE